MDTHHPSNTCFQGCRWLLANNIILSLPRYCFDSLFVESTAPGLHPNGACPPPPVLGWCYSPRYSLRFCPGAPPPLESVLQYPYSATRRRKEPFLCSPAPSNCWLGMKDSLGNQNYPECCSHPYASLHLLRRDHLIHTLQSCHGNYQPALLRLLKWSTPKLRSVPQTSMNQAMSQKTLTTV